ncbi:MAG: ImmA/IrrE family metallo-endopeptidase [Gemmatimonadetes bacterium]|nr:ImmA/IrrE family metallo-endopeptidase [Gemmatimonadota bacterium]
MSQPHILVSMLRQRAGVGDELPVNLDAIVGWCPLRLEEIPLDGFLGMLVPRPGKTSGILIKSGQLQGQRRFTIAHELGHFSIPTHAEEGRHVCLEEDLNAPAEGKRLEREANEFAAELLMPRHLFARDIGNADPCFGVVKDLASPSRYDVSRTACAIRLVKLTREPCAIVCGQNGMVEWWLRSENFRYFTLPARGHPIPADTVSAAIFRGEEPNDEPEPVEMEAWFTPRGETEEVYESTFPIPSLGQVLSLIWVIES